MPRIKEVEVYEFDELSPEAKERVIERHREFAGQEAFWAEFVLEEWKEKLEELGFLTPDIRYSGFWSQGDGASFTAKVDLTKYLQAHNLTEKYSDLEEEYQNSDSVSIKINPIGSNNYVHEKSIEADAEVETGFPEELDIKLNNLVEEIQVEARSLSRQIYKDLEESYEYDTSDEHIIEEIKANDYEFNADGTLA